MPSTEIQDYWRRTWGIGDRVGFYEGKLVKQGPNTGKWSVTIKEGGVGKTYYRPSEKAINELIESKRIRTKAPRPHGTKFTMTEKNKGARYLFGKNYNELNAKQQKKVLGS